MRGDMDPADQFRQIFFEECAERLAEAEEHLAAMTPGHATRADIDTVFRAVHSIKGGAGVFGFERLVRFTHDLETILDRLRSQPERFDSVGHGCVTAAFDFMARLVAQVQSGASLAERAEDQVLARLRDWARGQAPNAAGDRDPARRYLIVFRPYPHLLAKAHEPLWLIRELQTFANVCVAIDMSRLPPIDALEPDLCYLSWRIVVETDQPQSRLDEVFEFVRDDCDLSIGLDGQEPTSGLPAIDQEIARNAPAGETIEAEPSFSASVRTTLRVEIEKLDRLVNMVGEIVIAQTMLSQQAQALQREGHVELARGLDDMALYARELQDSVMSIRAQPVKSVFSRMPRLARETAAALGKDVRLEMDGEATEVDKTIIEKLTDPLTHMIRNAIDHGIESPDTRLARGKSRHGMIRLSARHRGGAILIEVADDGAGIDRAKLLKKCVAAGLVGTDARPSDEEIDNFIFMPGLSTAEQVTDFSGRGVGMDVVRRNILTMGGRIYVASIPGQGCVFTLSLPLTLAVLDGMVVSVGRERYVLPLASIVESLRPPAEDISVLPRRGRVLRVRGQYCRLLSLGEIFNVPTDCGDPARALAILLDIEGGETVGLLVDEILGQQQVVMKALDTNYRRIDGIAAATILGDGQVALILDIASLAHVRARPEALAS